MRIITIRINHHLNKFKKGMTMRILLIGSDGSLGSELLRQLKLNKLYTVYPFNKKNSISL